MQSLPAFRRGAKRISSRRGICGELPGGPGRPRPIAVLTALLGLVHTSSAQSNCTDSFSPNETSFLQYIDGKHYIALPDDDNWSRHGASGGLETIWSKLRLVNWPTGSESSVLIDTHDWTYSASTGMAIVTGDTRIEWGIAADCGGADSGAEMRLNLDGIPLRYEDFGLPDAIGYLGHGSVSCTGEAEGEFQHCTAICGGLCGFCGSGIPGSVVNVTLKVSDPCLWEAAVQASVTSTTTQPFFGNTTTVTSTQTSLTSTTTATITATSTTLSTATATVTTSSTATSTVTNTTTVTLTTTSTTSSSTTLTTTTTVLGWYYYRFSPIAVADESATDGCCCAHAISEFYMRNCGSDVTVHPDMVSNPNGSNAGTGPEKAFDRNTKTKWRDSNREPLIIKFDELTLVDEYSYATSVDCPAADPVEFELHGSQNGEFWVLLDQQVMLVHPPINWRPVQTEWFNFDNCTPTTTFTATSTTATISTTSSSTTNTTATETETITTTGSTTTSYEGEYVVVIGSGSCGDSNLFPINGNAECEGAARKLRLSDTSVTASANEMRPEGCYWYADSELWLGVNPNSKGNGAEMSEGSGKERLPICSSVELTGIGTATNLAAGPGPLAFPVLLMAAVLATVLEG